MKLTMIGVSGKAGSGKDTLANLIFKPRGYVPWAFAFPLKMVALSHGFTYDEVFHHKTPESRRWLQDYGQRKRNENPDHWVMQADGWMRTIAQSAGISHFVFTDVRYPNEVEYIKSHGGRVIRMLHGFGLPYELANTPMALHASETALDDWTEWDLVIDNHIRGDPEVHLHRACEEAGLLPDYVATYRALGHG